MSDPSLVRFRAVVEGALTALEARRQEVNDLNVFPVADGDTGDNMALTLRAVLQELDRLAALAEHRTVDEIGREEIVRSVARAALLGARGNSGVILSQLVRGAAEELISRPGELVDPVLVAAAMSEAANQAYGSVRAPAEGTILTVAREMANRLASVVAHMPHSRLTLDAPPGAQDDLLAGVLEAAVRAGEESVKRGPDLLAVLREAGVVDAGGYGLVVIFSGIVAALRGTAPPPLEHHAPARVTHPQHESSTFRFCTNFAVTGEGLDALEMRRRLEDLGDSVLVVGDSTTLKVHVHTDDPDAATALFAGLGAVSHLDVADMDAQVAERTARLEQDVQAACAAVAVVSSDGMATLFRDQGARPLDGGPTLNPSTYDLLTEIHAVSAEQVVLLPNSANVLMAAERAAELSDKDVAVVPTRSQQAGLVALTGFESGRPADENARAMGGALDGLRTGGVAPAARDDAGGRFRAGEALGYVDEELVAWGDPAQTLREVLARLGGDGAELLTAIAGADAPLDLRAVEGLAPAGVDVEPHEGGQPSWWWLLSAE